MRSKKIVLKDTVWHGWPEITFHTHTQFSIKHFKDCVLMHCSEAGNAVWKESTDVNRHLSPFSPEALEEHYWNQLSGFISTHGAQEQERK